MSLFLENVYGNKLVVKVRTYVKKINYFAFIQKVRPEIFYKIDVLKHFRSSRTVRLRPATLLKMRLWHRRFPVNFAKDFFKGGGGNQRRGDCLKRRGDKYPQRTMIMKIILLFQFS